MALCKSTTTTTVQFDCATFCDKWNDLPIPIFRYEKFKLIQKSTFFDSGVIQNRQYNWIVSSGDYEVYNFGWGTANTLLNGFTNGSTYSTLNMGNKHSAIITFLNNLPSTKILSNDAITITLKIKDCDGFESKIQSNKYKFNA